MINDQLASEIEACAVRIARIRPISNSNPAVFYEERSEVAHRMRALGEWARTGRKPPELDRTDAEVPIRSGRMHQTVRSASR
jgi:hypothetical protein